MTGHQLLLDGPTRADEIEAAARKFDHAHPEVFYTLVALAREEKAAGVSRGSIAALFEIVRRNKRIQTAGLEDYALNNSWRAYYARKIMAICGDLDGFFETRERRSEDAPARGDVA